MADATTTLRRFRHPWRIAVLAAVLTLASGASFAAGLSVHAPERDALVSTQERIEVTAMVERRVVDSRSSFPGTIVESPAVPVIARSLPGVPVVTRQALTTGEPVSSGDLVALVAGVPYFVLTGPLPLYRDLRADDRGDDVIALQRALNTTGADIEESGSIDWATLDAVSGLFDEHDLVLPEAVASDGKKTSFIPANQILGTGSAEGTVVSAAGVGTVLGSDTPLISIRTGPKTITLRADVANAARFTVGASMTARAGSQDLPVTVASIGAFSDAGEGKLAGRDVVLACTDPALTDLGPGTSVSVLSGGVDEEALAVPLIAVRRDAEGDYVQRRSDGAPAPERVPITVQRSGGGWAAVADGELEVGDPVLLS
ncbi:hypothetical protein [Rathayibacter sp. VKM Ac-2805]|uniref:hypothetical protein n=1 Tax=Rathayibacter sp. VKM Ac-2805 TaxID=2609258 RepID=UPI00131F5BE5|nr:hypothetical protein [Rathayibacter sp. VKM Ac-2805]QHC74843.1 hypothetical protein GSU40_14810 [Rathayibacter sp. VKM Ac-2805]